MPEGHIVHRLARHLMRTIGRSPVAATSPQGRFREGAELIDGHVLTRAEAWGKYLFCDFDVGPVLHIHLGLIGKLRLAPDPRADPVGQVRLRLAGTDDAWDLSGPTRCELISPDEVDRITARLGADPLRPRPDVATVRKKFERSRRPVGSYLLDQSVIAGIGNVYRAELLFICGINPSRPAADLSDGEFAALWSNTVELMRVGARLGRIVTTDPVAMGRSRSRINDADRLYVYHQESCRRCGSRIATMQLGGRPIWYCPTCQPEV